MQFWKDLPEITGTGTSSESTIDLEVDGKVERPSEVPTKEEIVFVGRMGGATYLVFGFLVEYEYIKPKESLSGKGFTRLKVEGTVVTVF